MITRYGQVIVSEDQIEITGFHFEFTNKDLAHSREKAELDAIEWAKKRLAGEK